MCTVYLYIMSKTGWSLAPPPASALRLVYPTRLLLRSCEMLRGYSDWPFPENLQKRSWRVGTQSIFFLSHVLCRFVLRESRD